MMRFTSSYTNAFRMFVMRNQSPTPADLIWPLSVDEMLGDERFTVTEGQRALSKVPMFATHAATPSSRPSVWMFTVMSVSYRPTPSGGSSVDMGPVSTVYLAEPPSRLDAVTSLRVVWSSSTGSSGSNT